MTGAHGDPPVRVVLHKALVETVNMTLFSIIIIIVGIFQNTYSSSNLKHY